MGLFGAIHLEFRHGLAKRDSRGFDDARAERAAGRIAMRLEMRADRLQFRTRTTTQTFGIARVAVDLDDLVSSGTPES